MESKSKSSKKDTYWMRVVVMLCMGWVTIWIYRSALPPLFSEIQGTVGNHSDTQMGMIASFYFAGSTFMQIPAGVLVDRFGKKIILIPGFLLFGIAALVISQTPSLQIIYAASVFAGLGCGCYYGAAYSITSENIPEEKRSVATAFINNGAAVGMGMGMILSSLLVKKIGLPWQSMMYLCLFLIAGTLLVFIFGLRSSKKKSIKILDSNSSVQNPTIEHKKISLLSLRMLICYLIYFGTCYGYYMVVTWLPAFLQEERGFQGIAIGFSSALVAFAAIPGALIFSRLADKHREKNAALILVLELGAAMMLLITVLATNGTLLLISLILYGLLGKLAVEPILISYISEQADPKILGTTLGIANFFGLSASIFAPTVTGMISDVSGSKEAGFYVSIFIMIFSALLFYFISSHYAKKEKAILAIKMSSVK